MSLFDKFDASLAGHDLVQDLKWDAALRRQFERDEASVLDRYPLRAAERRAIEQRDFRALYDLGFHPYLGSQLARLIYGNDAGVGAILAVDKLVASLQRPSASPDVSGGGGESYSRAAEAAMVDVTPYARAQPGNHPPYLYPDYASTLKRAPRRPLLKLEHTLSEVTGPTFADGWAGPNAGDLTREGKGEPIGERIIVAGRVLDEDGRALAGTLIELWQANAAGRYHHPSDQHNAPLDPNFVGKGHVITGDDGGYRFLTVKPGAYPWRNTYNAWRPQHLHFLVFGPAFATRLVTQMYFPGDPLLPLDPIFNSTADPAARDRLISLYDHGLSEAEYALGYRFNIVLRGRGATPMAPR